MWFVLKNNNFVAWGQNVDFFVNVCVCLKLLWQISTEISLCTLSCVEVDWICSVLGTVHLDCQGFVEIGWRALHLNVAYCLSALYFSLRIAVYMFVF